MTPRMGTLVLLTAAAVVAFLAWSLRPTPPTPALQQLPRATGALQAALGVQRAVRQRADSVTQEAADTVTAAVERVRQVRTTRPLDLSAALVDTSHARYVGGLELEADALATAAAELVERDAAFRTLAERHADTLEAHAARLDTLARAAVAEAATQHGRGLRRGLAVGALLGAALTLGLVLLSP